MHRLTWIIAAAALATACGGGGGDGPATNRTVSCLFAGDTCDTVTGMMNDGQYSALRSGCTGGGGTFADAACNTTGMLAGHCRYDSAAMAAYTGISIAGATMDEYFDSGSWTEPGAQAYCADPPAGTWIP